MDDLKFVEKFVSPLFLEIIHVRNDSLLSNHISTSFCVKE